MSPMGGDSLEELSGVQSRDYWIDKLCSSMITADGGGNIWLPKLNGARREIKRHGGHRDSEVVDVEANHHELDTRRATGRTSTQIRNDEKLYATCHCGAFQCYLTRPSPEFPNPSAKRGKRWLASDGQRYKALLDACNSCHERTGFEVISWVYVPASNPFTPDGSPLDPSNHPALKH
ncbi:putative CENP-V/GFA domain-containing protein [Seiridium cardinale]|uniref:CENP-V/GFA domain-containing protein n=1 Tax=Seiridium cardinale TaxID=138064 RepID=A0ABR2XVY5_9PEZI